MDEFAFDLLKNGIQSIREGEIHLARETLERIPNITNDSSLLADAWYWMSETSTDLTEKRQFLETALAYDLHHARARKSLAILDGKLSPAELIDPDHLPKPGITTAQTTNSQRFVCPNCGGRMVYAPDGQELVCEFCSRDRSIEKKSAGIEQDFMLAMATMRGHREPTRQRTFKCQGCGAEFLLEANILATSCTFCGSAHLVQDEMHELLEADAVIPMALDHSQAEKVLSGWMEKNHIKADEPYGDIQGVYLPVWSFDLGGKVAWNGERRENKKVIQIQGEDVFSFHDLAVPASKNMASLLDNSLAGFDLRRVVAYDARYLAGWQAEVYQVSLAEASLEARKKASIAIEQQIIARDGRLNDLKYSTAELFIESFKLILLPVWVGSYAIRSERFFVLINGQNGIVRADMPRVGLSDWLKDHFSIPGGSS